MSLNYLPDSGDKAQGETPHGGLMPNIEIQKKYLGKMRLGSH